MITTVLFIGDVHLKHGNAREISIMMEKIKNLNYDLAVLAGDVLDTHEKVDVQLLNRAYDLIRFLREKTITFVLVGNHDYINNQQFLTDAHWMNGMKEWKNVIIVDTPIRKLFKEEWFVFVPYVFKGKFSEALSFTTWSDATCIFAHQEFKGCKMGAFVSEDGDNWDERYPLVISGHVHERQRHKVNIIYPGSSLIHSFGGQRDGESGGLSIFIFKNGKLLDEERISLEIDLKKTIYFSVGDSIKSKDLIPSNRFKISGSIADIESFKKSKQYKLIIESNVKIIFNVIRYADDITDNKFVSSSSFNLFESILLKLIEKENDKMLKKDYEYCCK
jgi:DNA repair exonuclease SbcCD nuclease subunit